MRKLFCFFVISLKNSSVRLMGFGWFMGLLSRFFIFNFVFWSVTSYMVSLEQKEYLWKFKEHISKKVLPLFQCSKQKKEREFSMTILVALIWKLVESCIEKCLILTYLLLHIASLVWKVSIFTFLPQILYFWE